MEIDSDNPLGNEIRREMAEAYFVACRKMVDALEALKAFDGGVRPRYLGGDENGERAELLEVAAERVYFVGIQREAMRLFGDQRFFDDYEVPDEVRTRLGPRKKK